MAPSSQPGITLFWRLCVGVGVLVAASPLLRAQQPAGAPPAAIGAQASSAAQGREPAAAGPFMNVQVLKDLSATQLHDAMVFMEASTGANCTFCHVRAENGTMAFELDDKENKRTARKMIQMVTAINAQHFEGEPVVTCATCHQARREPNPVAPLAQMLTPEQIEQAARAAAGAAAPAAPGAPGAGGAPARPAGPGGRPSAPTETVDEVIDKYVRALGGREALQKVTTRVMKGTLTNRAGQKFPAVLEEKAGGRLRLSVEATPAPLTRAFDGTVAWIQTGPRTRELEGVDVLEVSRWAELGLALGIADRYTRLAVGRYDRIDGQDVISLTGRPSAGVTEVLYFSRTTGLLARRVARLATPLGQLAVQIDYGDYKVVDDLKVPFQVRVTTWDAIYQQQFSEVTLNAPVDDARFAKPAS